MRLHSCAAKRKSAASRQVRAHAVAAPARPGPKVLGTADSHEADIVVIGAGIGGLSCAALCQKYGLQVTVLESHTILGGAAHVRSWHLSGLTARPDRCSALLIARSVTAVRRSLALYQSSCRTDGSGDMPQHTVPSLQTATVSTSLNGSAMRTKHGTHGGEQAQAKHHAGPLISPPPWRTAAAQLLASCCLSVIPGPPFTASCTVCRRGSATATTWSLAPRCTPAWLAAAKMETRSRTCWQR
jgi:FAD dependent oxidoreductase